MPNVLNLLPGAVGTGEAQLFLGTVVTPAPNSPTAPLNLSVSWMNDVSVSVASWSPSWGAIMPQVGDEALIMMDESRMLRCVWWGPSSPRETAARAFAVSPQSLPGGPAQISLNAITFDAGVNFNLTNSEYVVPYDGIYDVSGQVSVVPAASAGTMQVYASIYVSGDEAARGERRDDVTVTGAQTSVAVHDRVTCNVGDTISLWAYTSAPTSLADLPTVATDGVGVAGLVGVCNYLSVTHDSFW